MASPKRWIVLLNKVPRGPLGVDEIRALLREGHLRHNDIAFEVPPPDPPPESRRPAEWKLLWQFPEFDRRLEGEEPPKSAWAGTSTPVAAPPERRSTLTEEEAKARAREQIPPELLDIPPEDLVVHTTADAGFPEGPPPETAPEGPSPRAVLFVAAGIALAFLTLVSTWIGSRRGPRRVPQVAESSPTPAPRRGGPPRSQKGERSTARVPAPGPRQALPEARVPSSSTYFDRREPDPDEPDRGEYYPDDDESVPEEVGVTPPESLPKPPRGARRVPRNPRSEEQREDFEEEFPDDPGPPVDPRTEPEGDDSLDPSEFEE